MTPSTSSSDSEDDEEKQKLSQAVDPDFLKRTTAQFEKSTTSGTKNKNTSSCTVEDAPVSKRAKLFENGNDCIDFVKPYSLDVTPECQNFIAKQLGKSLDRTIKEVSSTIQTEINSEDAGIKLFARSKSRVTEEDLKPKVTSRRKPLKKKKKKKKSGNQEKSSDSSSESESEKLKSVAVTADWVLNSI